MSRRLQVTRPQAIATAILLLMLAGVVCWLLWLGSRGNLRAVFGRGEGAVTWPSSPWKNARPGVKYVGDAACAACHEEIAETFRHHPMGRSLAPIAAGAGHRRSGSRRRHRVRGPAVAVHDRATGRSGSSQGDASRRSGSHPGRGGSGSWLCPRVGPPRSLIPGRARGQVVSIADLVVREKESVRPLTRVRAQEFTLRPAHRAGLPVLPCQRRGAGGPLGQPLPAADLSRPRDRLRALSWTGRAARARAASGERP